jgi:hypothetical protein
LRWDPRSVDQEFAPLLVQPEPRAKDAHRVEVGDTVRFRYLTDDKKTIKVTISKRNQIRREESFIIVRLLLPPCLAGKKGMRLKYS